MSSSEARITHLVRYSGERSFCMGSCSDVVVFISG